MPKNSTKIDKKDLQLLKVLQENANVTNIQLSKKIGLSPAPTLERVKKLEKLGYISSYHAEANAQRLGLGLIALVHVSLARQVHNAINSFTNQIKEMDEIVECYQVTGDYDYLLKIMVDDIPAFEKLIRDKLSTIEEIGEMETNVVLSKVKDSKVLPLNYS